MPDTDRRCEHRAPCALAIELFLARGGNGTGPPLPAVPGVLTSISRYGAGIALAEVMVGRTHLAYGPMDSDILQLNMVLPPQGQDAPSTLQVRPVWLKRETADDGLPPFRLGVEFVSPLPPAIYQHLNRQLH